MDFELTAVEEYLLGNGYPVDYTKSQKSNLIGESVKITSESRLVF